MSYLNCSALKKYIIKGIQTLIFPFVKGERAFQRLQRVFTKLKKYFAIIYVISLYQIRVNIDVKQMSYKVKPSVNSIELSNLYMYMHKTEQ